MAITTDGDAQAGRRYDDAMIKRIDVRDCPPGYIVVLDARISERKLAVLRMAISVLTEVPADPKDVLYSFDIDSEAGSEFGRFRLYAPDQRSPSAGAG